MKKISTRYVLFAAFLLITQAAPGAIPGPRGRLPVRGGGGCSGSRGPVPIPITKIPSFERPNIRIPVSEPPLTRITPSPEIPNELPRRMPSSEFGPGMRKQFPEIDDPFAPRFPHGEIRPPIRGMESAPSRITPREPTPAEVRDARKRLAADLKQIEALAKEGNWSNLGQHVQLKFSRPQRLPAELQQALNGVRVQSQQLQKLTLLDEQLAAGKNPSLSGADRNALPRPVRDAVDELNSVEKLKTGLGEKWNPKRDLGQLEEDLARFAELTKEPSEVLRLRHRLAAKAAQAGDAKAAEKLLPPGRTLRDLEKTSSGNSAKPPGNGKSPSSAPFDGFVPEAPGGAAAAPRQSAREGLPPIEEKVDATAKKSRRRAQEQVRDQIEVASSHLQHHLHPIMEFAQRADQLSQETDGDRKKKRAHDDNPDEAVAKALKRPLTPADRILLRGMKNKGMNTAQIVAQFRDLEKAESK